jgi:hypothetical protein
MPEYLAPGVYVEETSFRSKSIEGVSTSTTAFVGPTLKGPIYDPQDPSGNGTPELITSFGEFERIYGGLSDVNGGLNYLAHAVRNYFENGGSRLYVSRVFQPLAQGLDGDSRARSEPVVPEINPNEITRFVARMPGTAGNGMIMLRQVESPATLRNIATAPQGSMLRTGGAARPAQPARLEGAARPPFALPSDGTLTLTVGGNDVVITIHGAAAEAIAADALADPVPLTAENNTLEITVDGVHQRIVLPNQDTLREDVVSAINRAMRAGYCRLTTAEDAGAVGQLVIGSDRRGTAASVKVEANPTLGFPTAATVAGSQNAQNTVGDVLDVTADELNTLLSNATNNEIHALVSPVSGILVLATEDTGADAHVTIADDTDPAVAAALGITPGADEPGVAGGTIRYYVKHGNSWLDQTDTALDLTGWQATGSAPEGADLLTVNIIAADSDRNLVGYEDVGFDPLHPRWIGNVLTQLPTRRAEALQNLYAIDMGSGVSPFELRGGLFPSGATDRVVTLRGGNDGGAPNPAAYATALEALEKIEDISIVAAPGSSELGGSDAQGVMNALISHVERRGAYRIAVLDAPSGSAISEARTVRSRIDSTRAALYYPFIVVSNPLAQPGAENVPREIALPPSGFVCGIYARNDTERGVHKAPANEVVRGALRFETDINFAQQEVLNPLGINCLRFFPGRGYRVWGARTVSSDPEWKYVNIRRYFNYLERSIDRGTQWAVFEPNGERLWDNVRQTIADFLYNEWVSGALLGASPKEAYFVRCDRSTMTQNDLDNGRLICLIGVAALKPAEFVIFRIGQKTADART